MNVNFPDKVWARLATIAELREMSIADLLVETAKAALVAKQPAPAPTRVPPKPTARPGFDPNDPAVIAQVRELYDLKRSRYEIATEFGVSYQAIRTLCNHLGLTPRRHSHPRVVDDDWFLELYALHWSDREIAARMGVSDVTIGRTRRRLGLPSTGQPGRPSKTTTTDQENAA